MSDATAKAAKPAVLTPDLCVIGAGARGIALATAAAAFGVPVVLIEREAAGGRHIELAAKALIEAAARAQDLREAGRLGIHRMFGFMRWFPSVIALVVLR